MTTAKDEASSDRIRKLVADELACGIEEIADNTPLVSSGLLDSVSIAFLITAIEQEEGITIPDESLHIRDFETVSQMESLIARCRASASLG